MRVLYVIKDIALRRDSNQRKLQRRELNRKKMIQEYRSHNMFGVVV